MFRFSKKGRRGLPPSCVPASMAEYALPSLNTPKYPWKCLHKLFWLCLIILHVPQAFEDYTGSKCARVLNMARFYMQGLHRVLNMSEYGSINISNAWISLNMTEFCWMSLNMPENAQVNCSNHARLQKQSPEMFYKKRCS